MDGNQNVYSCDFRGYLVLGDDRFQNITYDWVANQVPGAEEIKNQRTQTMLDDLFMQMMKSRTTGIELGRNTTVLEAKKQ